MIDALKRIFSGFLFGIGISVGLIVVLYIADELKKPINAPHFLAFDDNSGLHITHEHHYLANNNLVILGAVKNSGTDTWNNIKIEAEIFNQDGVFINECRTNLRNDLKPAQQENFKVVCGDDGSNLPTDYGVVNVRITDAFFISSEGS
jgi:hypothetical protein